MKRGRWQAWAAAWAAGLVWSCGGSATQPSAAAATLTMPDAIGARYVTCATCEAQVTAVAEFPVGVSDPNGPGGTLESVETIARNLTRGSDVSRNTRPNAQVSYPSTTVPRAGTLTVEAGIVMSPAPPPRDAITLTVVVRLTDGRSTTRTVPVAFSD